jgi:hypothetical protein
MINRGLDAQNPINIVTIEISNALLISISTMICVAIILTKNPTVPDMSKFLLKSKMSLYFLRKPILLLLLFLVWFN